MVALLVEPVLDTDEPELQEWMNAQLNITLGLVAQGATMQAVPHTQGPAGSTTANLGTSIDHSISIVTSAQTLTPAATTGEGSRATGGEGATKEKYSQDEVAALLGFVKLDTAHKLPQF